MAATPIKWVKNKLGSKFFPITHEKAVRDDNGINLNTKLSSISSSISSKQDTLESGTNIKTVNNQSLLGSGNISIEVSGEYIAYPSFAINSVGHLIMTDGAEGLFTIENGHLKYNF